MYPWPHSLVATASVLMLHGAALGQNADAPPRPAYQALSLQEDWSSFDGTAAPADLFDPIKRVVLSRDGDVWASFGGQARLRYESWSNFNFVESADDDYLLGRVLLHGDLHVGEALRVFVEGKSALATDRDLPGGRRSADIDSADLLNAFVDVKLPVGDDATFTLRGGRQELLFGKQRLVSSPDWSNVRRSFDGLSAVLRRGDATVTAFATQAVPIEKYGFNQGDAQTRFWGVYSVTPIGDTGHAIDAYFLGLDRDDDVTVNGTTGREHRYTAGGRVSGKWGGGFDYDAEAAYQVGTLGDGDICAWMFGGTVGYTFADVATAPRLFLGLEAGSGDDEAGGDVEGFSPLFPSGHAYFGWIDAVGRQNIIDVTPGLVLKPTKDLTFTTQAHFFWRADTADALYNAAGAVARGAGGSDERWVGAELDLLLRYQIDRHLVAQFGYSHFFAGEFLSDTGPDEDIDFTYVSLEYTF